MFSNVVSDPILSRGGSASWIDSSLLKPEWIWHLSDPQQLVFEGVPLTNFRGWFIVCFIYFSMAAILLEPKLWRKQKRDPKSVLLVNVCISLFYVMHPTHQLSIKVAAMVLLVLPAIRAFML